MLKKVAESTVSTWMLNAVNSLSVQSLPDFADTMIFDIKVITTVEDLSICGNIVCCGNDGQMTLNRLEEYEQDQSLAK